MTHITFYFNAADKLETARKLAAKCHASRLRALVYTCDAALAQAADQRFWSAEARDFLPHVRCGHPLAPQTPVLIGDRPDELAQPDVLINLEDQAPGFFGRFARVLEIVGTDPQELERGRARYRFFRERGYELNHHDLAKRHT